MNVGAVKSHYTRQLVAWMLASRFSFDTSRSDQVNLTSSVQEEPGCEHPGYEFKRSVQRSKISFIACSVTRWNALPFELTSSTSALSKCTRMPTTTPDGQSNKLNAIASKTNGSYSALSASEFHAPADENTNSSAGCAEIVTFAYDQRGPWYFLYSCVARTVVFKRNFRAS
jgi:hypothetical protein